MNILLKYNIKLNESFHISTALCILLYSSVSTYVGLYGSGLFNFGSYVNLPTMFWVLTSLLPTSSFIFIENDFYGL